jgi:hypothetical protein
MNFVGGLVDGSGKSAVIEDAFAGSFGVGEYVFDSFEDGLP